MRDVLLLGASGSIGTQSLDILAKDRANFTLKGFSVGHKTKLIPSIIKLFPSVKHICVQEESDYLKLKDDYPDISFYYGDEGLKSIVSNTPCNMVVNALVGFVGLVPSIVSLSLGKTLCLANKESLVVGGALVNELLKKGKGKLYPIDSEHVAIGKLLSRVNKDDVDSIYITASGGPFRSFNRKELSLVNPEQALAHPTWKMGNKISIDSATMFNKGFEVVEAKWLYDYPLEKFKVILHDESMVHSFLKLKDGTILADVSTPDMHTPIAYALYETKVGFDTVRATTLEDLGPFHFHEFNPRRFPAVGIVLEAYREGGIMPAVVNAANEVAVKAFLDRKLPFLSIEDAVIYATRNIINKEKPTLDDIILADKDTRELVSRYIKEGK